MNPIVKLILVFLGVAAFASAVSVLAHGSLRESGSVVKANEVALLEARVASLASTVGDLRESLRARGEMPHVRLDGSISSYAARASNPRRPVQATRSHACQTPCVARTSTLAARPHPHALAPRDRGT